MSIFGWTLALRRRVTPEQQRAERNDAAMTAGVGLAALPGQTIAARIHRLEIEHAVRLVRTALDRQWWREATGATVHTFTPDEFSATLRKRLGAAAAVEANAEFAAILSEEIAILEQAVSDLADDLRMSHLAVRGRMLLEDLHLRMGNAEAVQFLGGVAVFTGSLLSAGTADAPAISAGAPATTSSRK
jgi:hypothetical protein